MQYNNPHLVHHCIKQIFHRNERGFHSLGGVRKVHKPIALLDVVLLVRKSEKRKEKIQRNSQRTNQAIKLIKTRQHLAKSSFLHHNVQHLAIAAE